MAKQTKLYQGLSTLKGKITQTALNKEGFTSSFTATITDVLTGESRTLPATGVPLIFTMDPENQKKQGIEEIRNVNRSVSSGVYTFTNSPRGLDLDAQDAAGSYANAKEWPVGTEFGITTSPQNMNYLKGLLEGTERFRNEMKFDSDQSFLQDIKLVYKPAFLTCGSSPTTTAATWAAVTDGEFAITIDGTVRSITGIDFSNVGDNNQVADKIETAIRTVTSGTEEVEWDGTQFIIRSNNTGSTSAITVLSTVAAPAGTDISGAGATNFLDGDTGNGTVTNKALGQIQLKDTNNYIGMNSGETDIVFKSDSQAERTLSQLASLSGSNDKVKISSNDTTEDYISNKITGGDGITVTEINNGSNETFDIDVDLTDTNTFKTVRTTNETIGVATVAADGKIDETFLQTTDANITTLVGGGDANNVHIHELVQNQELTQRIQVEIDDGSKYESGGTTTNYGGIYDLNTSNTTSNHTAIGCDDNQGGGGSFDTKSPRFIAGVKLGQVTDQHAFIGLGTAASNIASGTTYTGNHAAFLVHDGSVYASVSDGTQDISSAIAGVTLTNRNIFYIEESSGVYKFYINGTLVHTSSGNEPTTLYSGVVGLQTTANATKTAAVYSPKISFTL